MKDKSFEKLDELLSTKSYEALNSEEKLWVNEHLGGVRTYQKLAALIKSAAVEKEMSLSKSTKRDLVQKMKAQHQPLWLKALHYKTPAYVSFLIALLFLVVAVFSIPRREVIMEKPVLVKTDPIIDTVFVKTPADTVFIEKLVSVPVYVAQEATDVQSETTVDTTALQAKSLAEQEDFRTLLVQLK